MSVLLSLGLLISSLPRTLVAPVGTPLEVRLTTAVGSYASPVGFPVNAVLIAPVFLGDDQILPAGSTLSGEVLSVQKVGFGILHETAGIELGFNKITIPGGESVPISTRVWRVENGRERVSGDGRIQRVRSTSTASYRASGYLRTVLLWHVHAQVAAWAIKSLLIQVPEPEIYYPPGVELTLMLKTPILGVSAPRQEAGFIDDGERERITELIADLPTRTHAASDVPSDLINVVFLGSREQIETAFSAAGWVPAHHWSFWNNIRAIRAVGEGLGYTQAPMSDIRLNGTIPEMTWQKGFNDVSKRHHVRIWKQPGRWDGQEIWIGAGTRDIDFAFFRPGGTLTHRVETKIDQERDKIVNDLKFASCVESVDWAARPRVPADNWNATGDLMQTDSRLAVVSMADCALPSVEGTTLEKPLAAHGNKWHRFLRREILSAKSDLIRTNIYWRTYEGVWWAVHTMRHHRPLTLDPSLGLSLPTNVRISRKASLAARH